MALHTLLGANGTIATELIPILQQNNEQIRLVSRHPKPVEGAETIAADVLDPKQVLDAVKGSDIVYLLVGLQYDRKIWKESWPLIIRNTIDACKATGAKLIFFDNVYMYGLVGGRMTEETPFNPISEKGKIRAGVDNILLEEMRSGKLEAIIARAVDFYGPRCTDKSTTGVMVFDKLRLGKTAQWLVNADVLRSFNYTPDAAKAIYMLANRPEAFGQVWHLPAVLPALTGREFTAIAARHMKGSDKLQVIPKWVLSIMGLFNPFMKEMNEMMYQNQYAFQFDSSKFEKAFQFTPTPYEEAIRNTAEWFLQKK